MVESVRTLGVQVPVKLYRDTTLGLEDAVLDGEGRVEAAVAAGVDFPVEHSGPMTIAVAYELAKVFNDHRRQDIPEAIQRRRAERVERVAAARAEGKSLRTIAGEEGVRESTVRNDLRDAGAQGCAPAVEKVVGRDGKSYPATTPPPPKADSVSDPAGDPGEELAPAGGDDDTGPSPEPAEGPPPVLPFPPRPAAKTPPARNPTRRGRSTTCSPG